MWHDDLIRLLTLRDANTRIVLVGAGLLGLAAGVVGVLAVLRRRALVGDAVAHAALPGICVAFLVVGTRSLPAFLLGALIFGLLTTALISLVRSATRVKDDALIAIAIGSVFGLGIMLSGIIQRRAGGAAAGLDGFLFGKAAGMVRGDATLIAVAAAAALGLVVVLYKEFKLLSFDRDFAAAQGWPTRALDLLVMALLCVVTVVGLPAVGVVLIVALLIIPACAARFWTDRLGVMLAVAGAVGMVSGVIGASLSATLPTPAGSLSRGWPTGPLIVLTAASAFALSMLLAPRRGLLTDALRRRALNRRVADQNLLRAMLEAREAGRDTFDPFRDLVGERGWAPGLARRVVARAMHAGLIEGRPEAPRLTQRGLDAAGAVVRAHRLWELYLIEQADIAPDHVDRDADQLEHLLPQEVLSRLDEQLRARGLLPSSPHPLDGHQSVRAPGGIPGGTP
jgi:manganese/zinc/iron transport system permease protein